MDWLLWWAEGGFFYPLVREGFSHVNLVLIICACFVVCVAWMCSGFGSRFVQLLVLFSVVVRFLSDYH